MYQSNIIGSIQSNGKSAVSRRWKTDVKRIVNSYNFVSTMVHAGGGKCDFCGNNLVYVAQITGNKIVNDDTLQDNVDFSIGLDCLELTLGKQWVHFQLVKREIERLKEKAAKKRRAEKYAVDFADIIDWLKKKPQTGFYYQMMEILTTGNRMFTKSMENRLRTAMEREKKMGSKIDEYTQKLDLLLKMIVTIDKIDVGDGSGVNNVPAWSAYNFVSSVANQFKLHTFLTLKQKEALNKIYRRYKEKAKKSNEIFIPNTASKISLADIMKNIPY